MVCGLVRSAVLEQPFRNAKYFARTLHLKFPVGNRWKSSTAFDEWSMLSIAANSSKVISAKLCHNVQ